MSCVGPEVGDVSWRNMLQTSDNLLCRFDLKCVHDDQHGGVWRQPVDTVAHNVLTRAFTQQREAWLEFILYQVSALWREDVGYDC